MSVPWYDPGKALTRRVLERWRKDNPDGRFELNSGFGWESVQIVVDAFRRAKSARPADLHAALTQTRIEDHVMYGGPIRFDPKGQNPEIGIPLLQVQNQEPVVIGPKTSAQAEVRLPMTRWSARG